MRKIVAAAAVLALLLALAGCAAKEPEADFQISTGGETAAEGTAQTPAAAEQPGVQDPEPTEDPAAEETANPVEETANPVEELAGLYAGGRPTIQVEAEGADGAVFTVEWGSSAWENSVWVMSGRYDPETRTVNYEDAVRTDYVYGQNGELESSSVVYENGTGRFIFHPENRTLTWEDEKEFMAEGMVFTDALAPQEGENYYAVATSLDKATVEAFAAQVRQTILDQDWTALADMISYPMELDDGGQAQTAQEFIAFMEGTELNRDFMKDMEVESCTDLFAGSQGIMMVGGQVWLGEVHGSDGPELKIISIWGLTATE